MLTLKDFQKGNVTPDMYNQELVSIQTYITHAQLRLLRKVRKEHGLRNCAEALCLILDNYAEALTKQGKEAKNG